MLWSFHFICLCGFLLFPMAKLPPGFRFHPTDVELIMYYLKRKIMVKKILFEVISELNIYKFSPSDLPGIYVILFGSLDMCI